MMWYIIYGAIVIYNLSNFGYMVLQIIYIYMIILGEDKYNCFL